MIGPMPGHRMARNGKRRGPGVSSTRVRIERDHALGNARLPNDLSILALQLLPGTTLSLGQMPLSHQAPHIGSTPGTVPIVHKNRPQGRRSAQSRIERFDDFIAGPGTGIGGTH